MQQTSGIDLSTVGDQQVGQNVFGFERAVWGWESESRSPASVGRIEVTILASSPWLSAPPHEGIDVTALDGVTLTWMRHGERWWSTHRGRAGVELELLDDRARIQAWHGTRFGTPRFDADRAPWMMLALHVAICEAMRARGFAPLHAAVLTRDGHATALLGRSGVGKGTTLLSAVESGWLPIAEDFAWLDLATRKVYAWVGERGVVLDNDGRRRLPAHWRHAAWRQCDGKLLLAYDEISPWRPAAAELTRAVVLHRSTSHNSAREPLLPWESTRALWESAGVPLCRSSRDAFAARVPDLVSRLEWERLAIGRPSLAL